MEKLIKEKLTTADEKKITDLLVVLEDHFDPDKKPKLRISRDKTQIKIEKSSNDDKENNNKCDSSTESPDTTTPNSPLKIKSESENSTFIAEE